MKTKAILSAVLIVSAGAMLTWARAPQSTVTKVVAVAKTKNYHGPCPTDIQFVGTIFVSHSARVEYRWERSDGAMGGRQSVDIHSAGQGVSDTWHVGAPGKSLNGWVRLHVLAPTGITSNDATFEIHCD